VRAYRPYAYYRPAYRIRRSYVTTYYGRPAYYGYRCYR
jgi:hypothetical protein